MAGVDDDQPASPPAGDDRRGGGQSSGPAPGGARGPRTDPRRTDRSPRTGADDGGGGGRGQAGSGPGGAPGSATGGGRRSASSSAGGRAARRVVRAGQTARVGRVRQVAERVAPVRRRPMASIGGGVVGEAARRPRAVGDPRVPAPPAHGVVTTDGVAVTDRVAGRAAVGRSQAIDERAVAAGRRVVTPKAEPGHEVGPAVPGARARPGADRDGIVTSEADRRHGERAVAVGRATPIVPVTAPLAAVAAARIETAGVAMSVTKPCRAPRSGAAWPAGAPTGSVTKVSTPAAAWGAAVAGTSAHGRRSSRSGSSRSTTCETRRRVR